MSSRAFASIEDRARGRRRRGTKCSTYINTGWRPPGTLQLVTDDGREIDVRGLDIGAEEMFRRIAEAGIPLAAGLLDPGVPMRSLPFGMRLCGEDVTVLEVGDDEEIDETMGRLNQLNDNDPLVRTRARARRMPALVRDDPVFGFESIPTFA